MLKFQRPKVHTFDPIIYFHNEASVRANTSLALNKHLMMIAVFFLRAHFLSFSIMIPRSSEKEQAPTNPASENELLDGSFLHPHQQILRINEQMIIMTSEMISTLARNSLFCQSKNKGKRRANSNFHAYLNISI